MQRNSCSKRLIKIDSFGQPFRFTLPDKSREFQTVPGSICTIFMFMMLLIFAGYKTNVLIERREYSVLQEVFEYHYDSAQFRFGT